MRQLLFIQSREEILWFFNLVFCASGSDVHVSRSWFFCWWSWLSCAFVQAPKSLFLALQSILTFLGAKQTLSHAILPLCPQGFAFGTKISRAAFYTRDTVCISLAPFSMMSWIVFKLFIFDEIFAWKGFNKKSQRQGNSQNVSDSHDV